MMDLIPATAKEAAMSLTYEVPDPGQAPNRLAGMIASYLTNGQP